MVGGDEDRLGIGVGLDVGDLKGRAHGGLTGGGGEKGAIGGLIPVHPGAQLFGDEAEGDRGPVHSLVADHRGGHPVGEGEALSIDQGLTAAQGEDHRVRPPLQDHLTGFLHPEDFGGQGFGHQTDGHQRASGLHQSGHVAGEGGAVQGERHHVGLDGLIAPRGMVVEVHGDGAVGPGGPRSPQRGQQDQGQQ